MHLSSWKVWTPNRTSCTQSHTLSPTLFSCAQERGKELHSKKTSTKFCYLVVLEGLRQFQRMADTTWCIFGVCHWEFYLHSPSRQWAKPGGGGLRGFLSAALCELHVLVPSSFRFISVILSLFHLISNISGAVSRNPLFPVCIFCSLRTWHWVEPPLPVRLKMSTSVHTKTNTVIPML